MYVPSLFSHVRFFATPWTVAHQAPLSMGFSRQEYWRRLPCPSAGIFLTQGSNPCLLRLLHWRAGSLPLVPPGKPQLHLVKAKSWVWMRGQRLLSSTSPYSYSANSTSGALVREYWNPDYPRSSSLVRWSFHAGRGKPRRPKAIAPTQCSAHKENISLWESRSLSPSPTVELYPEDTGKLSEWRTLKLYPEKISLFGM